MKIIFLVCGALIALLVLQISHTRKTHRLHVELAEADCTISVLKNPDVQIPPDQINCEMISDEDLITFEVNRTAKLFMDCLRKDSWGALIPRDCTLYTRP